MIGCVCKCMAALLVCRAEESDNNRPATDGLYADRCCHWGAWAPPASRQTSCQIRRWRRGGDFEQTWRCRVFSALGGRGLTANLR